MSMSKRNFRAAYLTTLGFQNVRQSIESVINENVVDINHLRKLIRRYELPSSLRALVWKLLLGALPPIKEVWSFVTEQQTERYKDLKRAAKLVLQAVEAPDNDLLKSKDYDTIAKDMYIVFAAQQYFNRIHREEDEPELLINIAKIFIQTIESEVEAYWCYCAFLKSSQLRHEQQTLTIRQQVQNTLKLIENNNDGGSVLKHLSKTGIQLDTILYRWLRSAFISRFGANTIVMLWDKMIAYTEDFKISIAAAIILCLKSKILEQQDTTSIRNLITNAGPDPSLDQVLSKALELYTQSHPDHDSALDNY